MISNIKIALTPYLLCVDSLIFSLKTTRLILYFFIKMSRTFFQTNCVIKNVTRSMTKKGSLTHNGCYPIKGTQRRADYESTIKKEYVEAIFYGTKKPLVRKEPSSSTSSVQLAGITESMRFDYSEDSGAS